MSTPTKLTAARLRGITEARLTLDRPGRALDTQAALAFALDHARAREAVLSELNQTDVTAQLASAGLSCQVVTSAAATRDTYIRRPDLGRMLPAEAADALTQEGPVDVAVVLGDGLSATAVALNGAAFIAALCHRLDTAGLRYAIVCAHQARVALGDKIALALRAPTVVMALGERPGLSAADSLGVYVTHHPTPNTQDSARNCISNIRSAGTSVAEAADQTLRLITAMRRSGLSGVTLSQALEAGTLPGASGDTDDT